jgi:hypothetical protein
MRIRFFAPSIILLGSVALWLPACFSVGDDDAPSDDNDSCSSDAQCLNGQSCVDRKCVASGSGGNGGSGGGSGGSGGSKGGSGGSDGGSGGSTGGKGGSTGGDSGSGGSGGSGTGGTEAGTGGTEGGNGGTGGGSSGMGGSSGSSGETTPAKFCNRLTIGGESVTLTLDVGDVSISAATGVCAPTDQCIAVPAGTDVAMAISDESGVLSSGTYPEIPTGEEMVFFSVVGSDGYPSIEGWPGNGICSGGDGGEGTVMKFCNKLSSGGQSITLTLDLNGATVSAATGECAPVAMCVPITSGVDVPIALLDGTETVISGTYPDVPEGSAMMFVAEIDEAGTGPTVTGGPYQGICDGGGGDARMVPESGGARKSANLSYVAERAFSASGAGLKLDAAVPELVRGRPGLSTR